MGFVKVASTQDVSEGRPFCAGANGQKIAIFKVKGRFYALNNKCTHAGGPLCKGTIDGSVITCPWHGSKFDVTTGAVVGGPAKKPLQKFEIRVSGTDIEVNL